MPELFAARAELYRSAPTFEEVLALKLEPLAVKIAVPLDAQKTPREAVDWAVDLVRQMVRATRATIAETLFGAVMQGRAPKGFDWTKFEETEFEKLREDHKEAMARIERFQRIVMNYRGFMEANGKNWEAVERIGENA